MPIPGKWRTTNYEANLCNIKQFYPVNDIYIYIKYIYFNWLV